MTEGTASILKWSTSKETWSASADANLIYPKFGGISFIISRSSLEESSHSAVTRISRSLSVVDWRSFSYSSIEESEVSWGVALVFVVYSGISIFIYKFQISQTINKNYAKSWQFTSLVRIMGDHRSSFKLWIQKFWVSSKRIWKRTNNCPTLSNVSAAKFKTNNTTTQILVVTSNCRITERWMSADV